MSACVCVCVLFLFLFLSSYVCRSESSHSASKMYSRNEPRDGVNEWTKRKSQSTEDKMSEKNADWTQLHGVRKRIDKEKETRGTENARNQCYPRHRSRMHVERVFHRSCSNTEREIHTLHTHKHKWIAVTQFNNTVLPDPPFAAGCGVSIYHFIHSISETIIA